jgi:hypothetical protein
MKFTRLRYLIVSVSYLYRIIRSIFPKGKKKVEDDSIIGIPSSNKINATLPLKIKIPDQEDIDDGGVP